MHERVRAFGRDPDQFKVLFLVTPILGSSDAEAAARAEAIQVARWSDAGVDRMRMFLSELTGIDMSRFGTDMLVGRLREELRKPEIANQAGAIDGLLMGADDGQTLREIFATRNPITQSMPVIGSPATVAAKLDEIMEEIGGDGFLFNLPATRVTIAEVCDGLVPEMQHRGSVRVGYDHATLRENLLAF